MQLSMLSYRGWGGGGGRGGSQVFESSLNFFVPIPTTMQMIITLVVHFCLMQNVRLLSQFVSPHTGRIYGRTLTGQYFSTLAVSPHPADRGFNYFFFVYLERHLKKAVRPCGARLETWCLWVQVPLCLLARFVSWGMPSKVKSLYDECKIIAIWSASCQLGFFIGYVLFVVYVD